MALSESEFTHRTQNPLDIIEEIIGANEWPYERGSDEDLAVEVQGRWCCYRLFFMWDQVQGALHFSCLFETRVGAGRCDQIYHLLALVNERLWIGHFDLSSAERTLMYRHTLLFGGGGAIGSKQLEDFLYFIVTEPDRYYPAFQYVIWGGKSAPDAMASALIDVVGEA